MNNVKIICPPFATSVSNCDSSSPGLFIIGGGELKPTEGTTQRDPIAMITYANATIPLILMIIEIMHGQPGNTSKLAAYPNNVTATGTLTGLKILWNILSDLGPKYGCYP